MSIEKEDEQYYEAVNLMYELSKSHPDIAEYISSTKGKGVIFEGLQDGRKIYFSEYEKNNIKNLNSDVAWLHKKSTTLDKSSEKDIEPDI